MSRTSIGLGLALIAVSGGWLATWLGWIPRWSAVSAPSPPPAQGVASPTPPDEQTVAMGLGQVEPAAGILNLGAIPGDRVAAVKVVEGQMVKKGDTLLTLESGDLRQRQVDAAEVQLDMAKQQQQAAEEEAAARVQAAQMKLQQAQMGEHDIAAQQGQLDAAKAALDNAQDRFDRMKNAPSELVSPQERREQQASLLQAEADVRSAETLLEKARKGHELAVEAAQTELLVAQAAREQVKQSRAVEAAEIQLDLARRQLEETTLTAPRDGKVVSVMASAGETVGPTPLVQLADLSKMVVVAEVYEADVQKVYPGQPVLIESPAFGAGDDGQPIRLRGTVERVGQVVAGAGIKSIDPFGPADQDVVKVRVAIDSDQPPGAPALRVANLQVSARFLKPQAPSAEAAETAATPAAGR